MTHPSNLITDYLLAITCVLLAVILGKAARERRSQAFQFWMIAYVSTALAALAGGTYHGLFGMLGNATASLLWKVTVYTIGITSAAMLAASVRTVVAAQSRIFWFSAIVLKFVVFAWWMSTHDEFVYVIADLGVAIVAIITLQAWHGIRSGDKACYQVVAAMLIAVAGAILQQAKLSLHAHFDHNDLYHIVQAIALVVLARALLAMREADRA